MLSTVNRYNLVLDKIGMAATGCGRTSSDVQLVAVSKNFGADVIRPVLEAGHRVFGENRVQEAAAKWPEMRRNFYGVEVHLIGPLQSNKIADAVRLFDVIETVDRPKIADGLIAEMKRQGKALAVFIQVNTGDESQKAGVGLAEASDFIHYYQQKLNVTGLMCIPPVNDSAVKHFRILVELAARHGLSGLSMGMSSDFEDAIRAGSTYVRIGSAIFGAR